MNTFRDQYDRIYSVKRWTFQHLFCIFVYFVIFALPFYFSFASKNFWFDEQFALMQVNYHYTGYYAAQVNYINGVTTATKQIAVLPGSQINKFTQLSLAVQDSSTNSILKFSINGLTSQIISINMIVYFDVEVPSLSRVASAGFAFSVAGNIASASVSSKLSLQVASPFNALTPNLAPTINRPAYYDVNYKSPDNYDALIAAHLNNLYKIESETYVQALTSSGSLASRNITLNLLKDTPIIVPYYPSLLETLKLKYSTYFGLFMLSFLIIRNAFVQLIKDEALQCNQRDDVPGNTIRNT